MEYMDETEAGASVILFSQGLRSEVTWVGSDDAPYIKKRARALLTLTEDDDSDLDEDDDFGLDEDDDFDEYDDASDLRTAAPASAESAMAPPETDANARHVTTLFPVDPWLAVAEIETIGLAAISRHSSAELIRRISAEPRAAAYVLARLNEEDVAVPRGVRDNLLGCVTSEPRVAARLALIMSRQEDKKLFAALINSAAREPEAFGVVMTNLWLDPTVSSIRTAMIQNAVRNPTATVIMLRRLGVEWFPKLPHDERTALLNAAQSDPYAAYAAISFLDPVLDRSMTPSKAILTDDERTSLVMTVAHNPWVTLRLLAYLLPQQPQECACGCRRHQHTPPYMAGLNAFTAHERALLIQSVARIPEAAAFAVNRIGDAVSAEERAVLVNAGSQPSIGATVPDHVIKVIADGNMDDVAACIAETVSHSAAQWDALPAEARTAMLSIVAHRASPASNAISMIGVRWRSVPDEVRSTLIGAAALSPLHAKNSLFHVSAFLADDEASRLAFSATCDPFKAEDIIVAHPPLPCDIRASLLYDTMHHSDNARDVANAAWTEMDAAMQMKLAITAARNPHHAAELLKVIGSNRFHLLHEDIRNLLLDAVVQEADSAASVALSFRGKLTHEERDDLLQAVIGSEAVAAVGFALSMGAEWKDWMQRFTPDHRTSRDTLHLWRKAAANVILPPEIEQLLQNSARRSRRS